MRHVSIEICQRCPNKCIHCSSASSKECNTYISIEKLKEIVDGLKLLEAKSISISGGEPFLHSGLLDIVSYINSKGIDISIYTSGIVFNEYGEYSSLDGKVISKLSKIGVNKLIFNVQSLKEERYDEIMQTKGNLPLLMESIKLCKENNIFTEIHFVPMKLNIDEIDDMINFVGKFNLDMLSFLGLVPHGRAKDNEEKILLDDETSDMIKKKLNELINEKTRVGIPLQVDDSECSCYAGKEKLYVKFDGTVYGCEAFKYIPLCDDDNNEIIPDSIHDRRIEVIFMNSKYLQAEAKFIEEQKKVLNSPEKCPVQRCLRCKGGNRANKK
ncbi:radical SAM protein [Clostridium sp. WILCCON 0269]|uniref:Radical SAM protein n=1 Tax=Candidatus Clostridium eludens TaxID=3381663 RepID=A0ABW8SLH0_9CLOT